LICLFLIDFYRPHALNHANGDLIKDSIADEQSITMFLIAELGVLIGNCICYAVTRPFYTKSSLETRELIGFLLAFSGGLLRGWARWELGNLFTFVVGIRQDHELIVSGPYAQLLHPSYTGKLMLITGVIIYMGMWSNLLLLIPVIGFLAKRVQNEEKVLEETFGEKFKMRKAKIKRFIPGIF
jgi:protein-S-isoprenylcysteine O-methyltransferase Ste14